MTPDTPELRALEAERRRPVPKRRPDACDNSPTRQWLEAQKRQEEAAAAIDLLAWKRRKESA